MKPIVFGLVGLALATLPAQGAGIALTLTLDGPGDFQNVSYKCEGMDERLPVSYVNAAPNFLALVPVESKTLVFAATLTASGVRYVSGRYAWWTKGAEASLFDLTADEDAPPLFTCLEANDIP